MSITTFKWDERARMGWYSSIYSRQYLEAKSNYEARRRNWKVKTLGDGFYELTNKDETQVTYLHQSVTACDCNEYLHNETGTCQHIEVLKRPQLKKTKGLKRVVYIKYGKTPQLVKKAHTRSKQIKSLDEVDDTFTILPGVHEFLEKQKRLQQSFHQREYADKELEVFAKYGVLLRDYQRDSIRHMLKTGRNILALNMGLGKTICSLVCCKILDLDKIVIICPNTLKYQWAKEIERFQLGSTFIVNKGKDLHEYHDERFLIVNYEVLVRNKEWLHNKNFQIAIIDEIQRIKNEESKTWETISYLDTKYLFSLSGTPIQNEVSDIVSIIKILDRNKFTPSWRFYEKYCELTRTRIRGFKEDMLHQLKVDLEDYIINPDIDEQSFGLPTKEEEVHTVKLDKYQIQKHDEAMSVARPLLAKSVNYPLSFGERTILNSVLLKANRAATDGRLIEGKEESERFKKVYEIASNVISNGEKIVIYSQWIDSLKFLGQKFFQEGIRYVEYHGKIPNKKRVDNLIEFVNNPEISVFLSTDSGGLGVDGLQLAANHIIHVEELWNPMKMEQRNGRLVRILQKASTVTIHRFYSGSYIEDMIVNANDRKHGIIHEVLG